MKNEKMEWWGRHVHLRKKERIIVFRENEKHLDVTLKVLKLKKTFTKAKKKDVLAAEADLNVLI